MRFPFPPFAAIFSWTVTCILHFHPLGASICYDSQNARQPSTLYRKSEDFRRAAGVGFTVMNAIAIPTTSAIVARAAVLFRRRSSANAPSLTLRQLLVLVDRGRVGRGYIREILRKKSSVYDTTAVTCHGTSLIRSAGSAFNGVTLTF